MLNKYKELKLWQDQIYINQDFSEYTVENISEHSASHIDKILTTDIFNNSLKKGIIKSDVLDHFPIFFSVQLIKEKVREGVTKIKK